MGCVNKNRHFRLWQYRTAAKASPPAPGRRLLTTISGGVPIFAGLSKKRRSCQKNTAVAIACTGRWSGLPGGPPRDIVRNLLRPVVASVASHFARAVSWPGISSKNARVPGPLYPAASSKKQRHVSLSPLPSSLQRTYPNRDSTNKRPRPWPGFSSLYPACCVFFRSGRSLQKPSALLAAQPGSWNPTRVLFRALANRMRQSVGQSFNPYRTGFYHAGRRA